MRVNPVLCQGCGACAATCPSGAINLHHFTFDQVLAQVNALSDPAILMVRPWVHRPARARYQPVHWLITTQGDLLAATRRFLRDLWSNADLKGMLVMLQTAPDKPPSPVLVEDQTQLEASNPFAPLVNLNTAGLIAGLARSRPRERFAAILRPCELRALAEIQRQKPFNLDHWLIIGVDCLGSFSGEDFAWRLSKAGTVDQLTHLELRNARQGGIAPHRYRLACQMCSPLELPETDLYLGLLGLPVRELFLVTTKNQETADRLCLSQITAGLAEASLVSQHKRMLATTGERRSRFSERALRELDSGYPATAGEWAAHLSDCTFEQRCLEACPVYSLFGDGRQDLTDTVKRWVASCVECGLCEEACPEHLPLSVILRRLRKNISEEEVGRVGAPHLTT
jgi:formate dehydrogenase subunit beta